MNGYQNQSNPGELRISWPSTLANITICLALHLIIILPALSHFYLARHRRLTKPEAHEFNLKQGGTQSESFYQLSSPFFKFHPTKFLYKNFNHNKTATIIE